MRNLQVFTYVFFVLFSVNLAASEQNDANAKEQIVAEINSKKITNQNLEDEIKRQVKADLSYFNEEQKHQLKKSVLDRLIQRELISEEALSKNLKPNDQALKAKLEEIYKRFESDEQRNKFFESSNVSKERFEQEIANDMAIESYLKGHVFKDVTTNEKEALDFYNSNTDKFQVPEQVKARHILFKVAQDAKEEEVNKAKAKAEKVLAEAKKGADFAQLAKENSEGPTKEKGGDLGFFSRGQMVKPFEDSAFSLKPNEVSELVRTQFGFHIIKVEEKKEASTASFEEVKNNLSQYLVAQKQQEILAKKLAELKEKAKVIVYLN